MTGSCYSQKRSWGRKVALMSDIWAESLMKLGNKRHAYLEEEHSRRREQPGQVLWCRQVLEKNGGKPLLIRLIRKTYFGALKPVYGTLEVLASHRPRVSQLLIDWNHCLQSLLWQPLVRVWKSETVSLWKPVLKGRKYCLICCHSLYPAPRTLKSDAPIATWML